MIAIIQRARLLAWLLAVALAAPLPIAAQQPPPPPPQQPPSTQPGVNSAFTAEQLEQVVAPIALYPDALLAQVLMASTYPLEVVEAARFVKANPNLKEDQLNEKLKDQTWDDSVKSLVSFPQVLELMDQKLDWVQRLGDAFLAQQKDVLDAVQRLRARAQKEGNLKSTPEQKVSVEPAPAAPPPPASGQQTVVVQQQPAQIITIEPTNPQVVYVPSYNPTVVYGAWPYPASPPYYPYPPGYAFGAAALSFGVGMAVGAAVWGNCNWGGGEVNINNNNYNNYTKNVNKQDVAANRSARVEQRQSGGGQSQWQHSPENRKGVQYRDQATQQKFNRGQSPQATQSRDAFRGRAEQGRQDLGGGAGRGGGGQGLGGGQAGAGRGQGGQGLGGGQAGGRGDVGGGGAGRGQGGQGIGGGQAGGRGDFGGGQSSLGGRQGGGGAGAFQGAGSGGDARNYSNRGQSSRQSMGGGGGASRPSGGGGGGRAGGGGGGGGGGRGGGRR